MGLKKYFYVVGLAAVGILIGAYWYLEFNSKGVVMDSTSARPASRAAAVNQAVPGRGVGARQDTPPPARTDPRAAGIALVPGDFAAITKSLRNSVVNVNVGRKSPAAGTAAIGKQSQKPDRHIRFANPFSGRSTESVGSGIIVRSDGYILTNYHIVRSATSVFVTVFDGLATERYGADIEKLSETLDLVLLKIKARAPLTPAPLGDSDRLQVADEVIAIGSPFGLDQTVSRGIVSAMRKSLVIEGVAHENLIQTDAAINQGNSGGPLIDKYGHVVGINTAIYTPTGAFSGIGFAVPVNMAKAFLRDEIELPTVTPVVALGRGAVIQPRPRLNMNVMNVAANRAGPPIVAGTAAPHADGRQDKDCTTCHRIIDRPLTQARSGGTPAAYQYRFAKPPSSLAMNVLGVRDVAGGVGAGNTAGDRVMGAIVRSIDPILAKDLDHPVGKGVFVSTVFPGSPAGTAGLEAGDIILKLDGKRIRSPGQLARIMSAFANNDSVRVGVLRNGRKQNLFLTVAAITGGGVGAPPAQTVRSVPKEFHWMGMEIETFTQVNAAKNPGEPGARGAVVNELTPGSDAARAGIQANDVILRINGQAVGTPALLDRAIRKAAGQRGTLVRMRRNNRDFFVSLQ